MSAKTTPIGPFAGINNRLPDHKLGITERGQRAGDYLRNAVNVDLTSSGTLQRRKGVTLAQAGDACHSLWADAQGAFYVDGDTLYAFPRTAVLSDLPPGNQVSFARAPTGDVYWSNGVTLGRITGNTAQSATVPTPNPAPLLRVDAGGGLPAGVYQVAVTAVGTDGGESGATWPVQIEVSDGESLTVFGMPTSPKRVYVSPCNGDVLFLAGQLDGDSVTFSVPPQQGPQIQTLGLRPMPAGHIVRWFNGRLLVASGRLLYYSEPYAGALYNPLRGYVAMPDDITLVEPCGDGGVYLATARETWWLAGADIDKAQLVPTLPYGAVPGASARVENTEDVWWFSQRGVVIGDRAGQIKNIQEQNVAVQPAKFGAALYREQGGMQQLVTSVFDSGVSVAAASSFMEAEVVRKEMMR